MKKYTDKYLTEGKENHCHIFILVIEYDGKPNEESRKEISNKLDGIRMKNIEIVQLKYITSGSFEGVSIKYFPITALHRKFFNKLKSTSKLVHRCLTNYYSYIS